MKIYCARQPESDQAIFDKYLGKDIWIKVIYGKPELDSAKNGYCHTIYWARPHRTFIKDGLTYYSMSFIEIYNEALTRSNPTDHSGYYMTPKDKRAVVYALPFFEKAYQEKTGNLLQILKPIELISTEELLGA